MPIASPAVPVTGPSRTVPGNGVGDAPAPGFGQAFEAATARLDPSRLPSVALGTMVSALAGEKPEAVAQAYATARVDAVGPAGGVGTATIARSGSLPADPTGAAIIAAGERYLGVPYLWGGTDPARGLDCSGFVQRVFADLGVRLPRVSVDQSRAGQPVASMAEARPGDLVFWRGDGRRPNHIGIYAGNGQMLVAPRTGDVVRYQDITRTPHVIRRVA